MRRSTLLSPRILGQIATPVVLVLTLLTPACGSDDGAAGGTDGGGAATSSSGGGTTPGLTAKHPGPCSTTYVTSKGKEHKGYVTRTWDANKRLVEEKTAEFAESLDALRWTHKWTFGQKGQVLTEEYETSDPDEPNFKWDYSYDDKGRPSKRKGYQSGWTRAECSFEYYASKERLSGRICAWELDNTDDDGNVTSTDKGKHIIAYSYGPTQLAEEWSQDGASAPDKVVTKKLNDMGKVTREETQWELKGYSEHTVTHEYDAAGNLTKTVIDSDADDNANQIITRTWDKHGNALTVSFDDDADGKANWVWKHTYECWEK